MRVGALPGRAQTSLHRDDLSVVAVREARKAHSLGPSRRSRVDAALASPRVRTLSLRRIAET